MCGVSCIDDINRSRDFSWFGDGCISVVAHDGEEGKEEKVIEKATRTLKSEIIFWEYEP